MLSIFWSSLSGVLIILIMIAAGFVMNERHWFTPTHPRPFQRSLPKLLLPTYMISTITTKFTAAELKTLLPDLRYPVLSMLILFALSFAVARALAIKRATLVCSVRCFNSNTVFIGLPINLALFGARSVPYVLVYYMANTTFFWTLGVWLIQHDGMKEAKIDFKQALGKLFSPPLLGFMLAVVLVALHIRLPKFIISTCAYLGNLTIPMSMLFIGIVLSMPGCQEFVLRAMPGDFAGPVLIGTTADDDFGAAEQHAADDEAGLYSAGSNAGHDQCAGRFANVSC